MWYDFFRKEKILLIGMFHAIMRSIHYSRNRVGYGFARIISLISYYYFIDFIYALLARSRRSKACEDVFHWFHTIMESMKYHFVLLPEKYFRKAASVTGFRVMTLQSHTGHGFINQILAGQRRLRVCEIIARKPAQTINLQKYGLQARAGYGFAE